MRTADHPELQPLGVLLPATEITAITRAAPAPGLAAAATAAIVATIARDSSGSISSAEVRFDVRYRFDSPASPFSPNRFTAMHVHAGSASGPVVFDSGLTDAFAGPNGEGTLTYRQQIDASNIPAVTALETLAQDPASLYFELHTYANPSAVLGGKLAATETLRYILNGTPISGAAEAPGAVADGAVVVKVLRSDNGDILAGLATLDWIYRGFSSGSVFTGVGIPGAGTLALDPAVNGLTAGPVGTGSIFQRVPLLPGSPLLNALARWRMARREPAGRADLGEPLPEGAGRPLLPELDREER